MRGPIVVTSAVLAVVVAGVFAVAAMGRPATSAVHSHEDARQGAHAMASLVVDGYPAGGGLHLRAIDWDAPLRLTGMRGIVTSAVVTGPEGVLAGHAAGGIWTSDASLLPAAVYRITVDLTASDGKSSRGEAVATTSPASEILHATIATGDRDVVGVGEPVVVSFDHHVRTVRARREVTARLSVVATPAVTGAWHWVNDVEVHYRPAAFWRAGTRLHVHVNLARLNLTGTRTWGSGTHTSDYSIGDALVSTVDVTAHTMVVRRNGAVLRTLPVSTGRDKYPTKGGVHLVLEKQADQLFDSRTVGIPTASPDGYFEHLPWSVRISDGGAFVHANPATLRFQGVTNVSHGCVNLSVLDAEWYFQLARRGDVVDVIHAAVGPDRYDPGMEDWNVNFHRWQTTAFDA